MLYYPDAIGLQRVPAVRTRVLRMYVFVLPVRDQPTLTGQQHQQRIPHMRVGRGRIP